MKRTQVMWMVFAAAALLADAAWAAQTGAPGWGGFTPRVWELAKRGGYTMIPIGLCSVVAIAVTLERIFSLRRKKVLPPQLVHALENYWRRGDFDEAIRVCERFDVPFARILRAGLVRRHLGISEMERAMVGAGQHESTVISRNLRSLGVIANLAPMLGLFGTVVGMIRAFDVISRFGTGNPSLVAEGISEALLTTAAGLLVGIPSLAAYHFFLARGNRFLFEIESIALELLQVLAIRTQADSQARPAAPEKE
ncbi:MAG: MotA/TolQ/ExbB proton channel family protein, partial [bacterium]|nr:MotA/TolQ/ExbB proton channel family protein [bacterium]